MSETTSRRYTFIINTVYFALVGALIILGARFLVPWLLPFIMGYAIAMLLRPAADMLSRWTGLGPKLSGSVVVLLTYAIIALLLVWGGTRLVSVLRRLFAALPYFYEHTLEPGVRALGAYINHAFGDIFPGLYEYDILALTLQDFQSALLTLSTSVLNFLGTLGANIPGFLLAFFFTILASLIISANYSQIAGFLSRQVPRQHRALLFKIKNDALKTVGNYLIAYLKIMCVTFLELTVGLVILGVSGAPLVALGIALLDVFPVLGVGTVLVPWAALELLRGNLPMALGLAVLYAIVAVVRGFIEPRIIGGQLGLHPLVTLCAIYAGFALMGVLGMVLFPMLAQMMISLHRSGVIRLWRS